VELKGKLRPWVSAKDIILHLLRVLTSRAGWGRWSSTRAGGRHLERPERATITNMGAELGATSSVFPSDKQTLAFLKAQGRAKDWKALTGTPKPPMRDRHGRPLQIGTPRGATSQSRQGGRGEVPQGPECPAGVRGQLHQLLPAGPDAHRALSRASRCTRRLHDGLAGFPPGVRDDLQERRLGRHGGGWGACAGVGLWPLYRHGAVALLGCRVGAQFQPQLRGSLRHQGRQGFPGVPRGVRGGGLDRKVDRPEEAGGLPQSDLAPQVHRG
jgi:hypothetical protein